MTARATEVRAFAFLAMTGCWTLTASFDGLDGGSVGAPDSAVDSAAEGDAGVNVNAPDASVRRSAYVVVAGGDVKGAPGAQVRTERTLFAEIFADGGIGTWSSGPPLPSARDRVGVLALGDTLHVVGGYISDLSVTDEVASAALLDGDTLSSFATTSMANITSDSCPVVVGSRAYVINPGLDRAQSAAIAGDRLGAWRQQGGIDAGGGSYYGSAVAIGDRLFWLGSDRTAVTTTVGPDGNLAGWQQIGPTPIKFGTGTGTAAAYGRYVYVIGGFAGESGVPSNEVFVAEMASDGSLGTWRSVEPFPIPRYHVSALVDENRLYVFGGSDSVDDDVDDVSVTTIAADGTLAAWQPVSHLPEVHRGPCLYGVVRR